MASIDPLVIVRGLIILILSIAVHEFAHAWVADKLGDRLPRHQGRVTLNPMAHVDPIGTLLFPVIGMLGGIGFGWGKPVMVNPASFTRKMRMRTGHMLVAAAGPAMNILFAIVISLILFALYKTETIEVSNGLFAAISMAIQLNFILAFFNMIPCPPLDGGTVLAGLLPDSMMPAYEKVQKYGFLILLAFIMARPLQQLFLVPAQYCYHLWAGQILGMPVLG